MPLWFTLKCKKNSIGSTLEIANFFFESGNFASAVPDFLSDDLECSNDPSFGSLWGLNNNANPNIDINVCQAWGITQGNGIKVAVLDQGIELTHQDLISNIFPLSYNTETNTAPSQVFGYHGTHVAGTIAAIKDNNIQVVGVSPLSNLMSVSNSLEGTPNSRIKRADGINWAYLNGADIISNSWGSTVQYQAIDDAIENAITSGRNGKGTIIVFSSGNENGAVNYPANVNPKIIAVGAITSTGSRSSFSNYGSQLDVVAPGSGILSTMLNNTTGSLDGTSMATPHVAGVCALILSANPSLTGQQVRNIIEQTSQKVGGYSYTTTSGRPNGIWNDQMGYGLIDAFAAVQMAQCMVSNVPISGNNIICNSEIYTAPTGGTSYNWTITQGANLVNLTGNGTASTTLTAIPNLSGQVTLSLTMGNNCGNGIGTKNIFIGKPDFYLEIYSTPQQPEKTFVTLTSNNPMIPIEQQGVTATTITKVSNTGSIVDIKWLGQMFVGKMNPAFTNSVTATATNACGTTTVTVDLLELLNKQADSNNTNLYKIYPNPSRNIINIDLIDKNKTTNLNAKITAELYDLMGQPQNSKELKTNADSMDVSDLKKGIYILKIIIDGKTEGHQVIIE